jgi:hypothetical protein
MQEDVQHRSVTLAIKGAKLTEQMLKAAIKRLLVSQKSGPKNGRSTPKISRGKQSVKKLIGQNQGVSNIEITDKNIKSFERVARKYGVDFAVKSVRGETPPKYYVFFKARDADALTAAFTEYSAKRVKHAERPSVLTQLRKMIPLVKDKMANHLKNKRKEQAR